jgi:hypothetical protein
MVVRRVVDAAGWLDRPTAAGSRAMFTAATTYRNLAYQAIFVIPALTSGGTSIRRSSMMIDKRRVGAAATATTLLAGAAFGVLALGASASADPRVDWTSVPANPTARGIAVANGLSPELRAAVVAQGSNKLENPSGLPAYYGYLNDGTLVPDPLVSQSPTTNVEASKTEPDKNTYLRMPGLHGADPHYRYGTHFLFQGHEGGKAGYLTRINLDADEPHRVTLLATTMSNGLPVPNIDGSTWDPFAKRLLFTQEAGNSGDVLQATPDINATVDDLAAVFGRGGYEGIQNDSDGNVWIVEDTGGASPTGSKAKNPNSFVFRFVPNDRNDLTRGGTLQAMQVLSNRTHTPITFQGIDAAHPTGGIFTDDQKDISSYGQVFDTNWVTVHDTNVDHSGQPFDANASAKAAGATPMKRPENGVFRPGTGFREFFFETTGDTNAGSDANAQYGGWGGAYQLVQSGPSAEHGKLRLFFKGDRSTPGWTTSRSSTATTSPTSRTPEPPCTASATRWTRRTCSTCASTTPTGVSRSGSSPRGATRPRHWTRC